MYSGIANGNMLNEEICIHRNLEVIFLYLFTNLFHKDCPLLVRKNCIHYILKAYLFHLFLQGQKHNVETALDLGAHCHHTAWIVEVESQHGNPDHPKNCNQIVPCVIAELSEKFIKIHSYVVQ